MPRVIDISVPLSERSHLWPGHQTYHRTLLADMTRGEGANVSSLTMSAHFGTHVDAPRHFIADGETIEVCDLDLLTGPALVADLTAARGAITAADLAAVPSGTERLLLKTTNSALWVAGDAFREDYVALSPEAAAWVVENGVRLVGIDYLSVGSYGPDNVAVHHILLGARVQIVEGLDFSRVSPGVYDFVCLPLHLVGSDGAPARAVLFAPDGAA